MKKFIYFLGILCSNLILFGSLFKVQHWPAANMLLIAGLLICCILFLPLALYSSYQNQEEKKYGILYVVSFLVFFTGLMGSLFKIEHWPGAGIFLLIGIPLPFILFLPVYLYQTRKIKNISSNSFLGIVFGLIFLAVYGVLLSLNVSKNILDKISNNIRIHEQDIAFIEGKMKPSNVNEKISRDADSLCIFIDEIRCSLLSASGNVSCEGNLLSSQYFSSSLANADDKEISTKILFSSEKGNIPDLLENKLSDFRENLLKNESSNKAFESLIKKLFNTSAIVSQDDPSSSIRWQEREFKNRELIIVLNTLSRIKRNIRLVEAEAGK